MYDFKPFKFSYGSHPTREDGTCYMECVAYLAGEPHSDRPACASPVITELAIWLNDSFRSDDDARQKAFEPISPLRIIGTRASDEIEQQRAYMAADFAVRFVCPRVLDRAGFHDHANTLRNLSVIDCGAAAGAAASAARAAADATARAAADAAVAAGAAGAAKDLDEIRTELVCVIDRMIRLTEPQEVVIATPALEKVEA